MLQELVLSWEDHIGAHAAVSPMTALKNWFCLAPVVVRPEWQDGALGAHHTFRNSFRFDSRLVKLITDPFLHHDLARRLMSRAGLPDGDKPPTPVVLGKSPFCSRCGFSQTRAARLVSPYPIHETLIARPCNDIPEATLVYPTSVEGS